MRSPFAYLLSCCLVAFVACDADRNAAAPDPDKCATSKDCPEGKTCYGSRCLTDEQRRAREAELASKSIKPATPPPPTTTGRVPAFDTSAYCETVSQAVGGSFVIKRQCEADEERARGSIAAQSPPDRIYNHCEGVGQAVGGSYSIVAQCIKDELEAAAQTPADSPELGPGKVPGFDIEKYCETVSQTVGGSFEIKRTCEEQERLAKVALSRLDIPKRIYRSCNQTARVIGGSFEIMKTCVEQELAAMRSP